MKLTRARGVLLALSLGTAAAIAVAVAVQGAAGASAAMHVKFTGKDWSRQLADGTDESRGQVSITRRSRWGGTVKASDPRVSGTYRTVFDVWAYPSGALHFTDSSFALANARGVWKGTSFGARGADGSHYVFGTNYGSGAYEGLRYRVFVHDKASGAAQAHTFDIDGWIERATSTSPEPVATGEVHAKVTGTNTPKQVLPFWGDLRAGTEKTSDPRTSGTYGGGMMKLYRYADGRMHFSGLYLLRTDRGAWEGVWYGVVTRDRRYIQFVDALGTGAFEGLRYRHVDTGRYPKSGPKAITLAVNGWIESVK